MTTHSPIPQELLDASDATIEDAVMYCPPLALRGLLYQLTGDETLAEMEVAKVPQLFRDAAVLVNESDIELVRARAAELLKGYRDSGRWPASVGPLERLPKSLGLAAGEPIPEAETELWIEEFALDPFARGLEWQQPPTADQLDGFSVVVLGAGMGGINAAVLLERAGIPYTVIEKNSGVGGTWFENRYPGARVDSPSRSYMHIFGLDFGASSAFCGWEENERYFNWAADRFGVRDKIVFDTEATSCVWDEETATWVVQATGPDGRREWRANVVISAVGLFGRPNLPEIEGMDSFAGHAFHTARWPADLDLAGKRVGVIGTGCSGYQSVPEIALEAEHVHVFQRTPQWLLAIPGYRSKLPPQTAWLDRNLPYHLNFMRFFTAWSTRPSEGVPLRWMDPDWDDPLSSSAANKRMRDFCIEHLEAKFHDRPDLLARMTPKHPVWSARPVIADVEYNICDALLRDNVDLVTEPLSRITPAGIQTQDGAAYDLDVIVYATGFKANDFLWPMALVGRGGVRVEELWAEDGPRAHLGCMLPGFPNFFMLYGPNTNPMGGLGVVDIQEMVTRYALQCIEHLLMTGSSSIDVSEAAYWSYNAKLDEYESQTIYGAEGGRRYSARNYYQNSFGRSSANSPFPATMMWDWLRRPDLSELTVR